MGGLKILWRKSVDELIPIDLFEHQVWRKEGGRPILELEFNDLAYELILGYSEPYKDASTCRAKYKPSSSTMLGGLMPITFSQSAWFDLQGVEQLVFLRLMKAVQSNSQIVRLDGTHGQTLDDLLSGINLRQSGLVISSNLFRKLKFLSKIGRKLVEHGVLDQKFTRGYTASLVEGVSARASLLWRDSSLTYAEELGQYQQDVSVFLCKDIYQPGLDDIVESLAGKLFDSSLLRQVRALWVRLFEGHLDKVTQVVCRSGTDLFMAGPLFVEWMIRSIPGHEYPLPECLLDLGLGHVLGEDDKESAFLEFIFCIQDRDDIVQLILNVKHVSLVSPISLQDSRVLNFLGKRLEDVASQITQKPKSAGQRHFVDSQDEVARKGQMYSVKTRREASLEVRKLRAESPLKYATLKASYISSLEPQARKIFKEIENRLSPKAFEEQISHKLVKYIMENPLHLSDLSSLGRESFYDS